MIDTTLSPAQETRLGVIADLAPDTKVIGWSYRGGPIIRRGGMPLAYVRPNGRVQKLSREPRQTRRAS